MAGNERDIRRELEEIRGELVRLRAQQAVSAKRYRVMLTAALCGGLALATAIPGGTAGAKPKAASPKEIVASKIRIVGADGRTRMTLGSDTDGGAINVYDTRGHIVTMVCCDHSGGYLRVHDPSENAEVIISTASHGGQLKLYNKKSEPIVDIGGDILEAGTVQTFDAQSREATYMGSSLMGGEVYVKSDTGTKALQAIMGCDEGGGSVTVYDEDGSLNATWPTREEIPE